MPVSLRKLLLLSLLPCIIGLTVLGGLSARRALDDYDTLGSTEVLGSLINATATLCGMDIPTEGIASGRFSVTGDPTLVPALEAARRKVDQSRALFQDAVTHAALSDPDAVADVNFILGLIGDMESFRKSVDARRVSVADIIGRLQPSAPRAFDLIKRIGLQARNAEISKLVDGFYGLLQFIDGTHMENSAVMQALPQGRLNSAESEAFFVGVRLEELFGPSILANSPPSIADKFSAYLTGAAAPQLGSMRDIVRTDIEGRGAPVTADLPRWGELLQQREAMLLALVDEFKQELSQRLGKLVAGAWSSFIFYCAMTLGILLSASALSLYITRLVASLITGLSAAMTELADGNMDVAVVGADRDDEIGRMARSIQVFKDAGRQKLRLQAEADRNRGERESEQAQNTAAREGASDRQARVVASLAKGLGNLSSGHLAFRLLEAFSPEYETLRIDFNTAMETLEGSMKAVGQNTAAIRSGAGELSAASDDLSRRTEQQAASLEQTAAAIGEITTTVKKTSDGSIYARRIVALAKSEAEQSGEVVSRAVGAMSEIEASSLKVSQIIGVIDEIAFQTNLLALNAGVEAARAGEAGRGFAVVASEVRGLAQRSAEAAKEIKTLISQSGAQVKEGVNLVGETGKALERIAVQVAEINDVVTEIASNTQDQASALQEVNTALNQMDQVTQQNAAMVEQSTAASHGLTKEAENLTKLMGRFHISQDEPSSARTPHARARAA